MDGVVKEKIEWTDCRPVGANPGPDGDGKRSAFAFYKQEGQKIPAYNATGFYLAGAEGMDLTDLVHIEKADIGSFGMDTNGLHGTELSAIQLEAIWNEDKIGFVIKYYHDNPEKGKIPSFDAKGKSLCVAGQFGPRSDVDLSNVTNIELAQELDMNRLPKVAILSNQQVQKLWEKGQRKFLLETLFRHPDKLIEYDLSDEQLKALWDKDNSRGEYNQYIGRYCTFEMVAKYYSAHPERERPDWLDISHDPNCSVKDLQDLLTKGKRSAVLNFYAKHENRQNELELTICGNSVAVPSDTKIETEGAKRSGTLTNVLAQLR